MTRLLAENPTPNLYCSSDVSVCVPGVCVELSVLNTLGRVWGGALHGSVIS